MPHLDRGRQLLRSGLRRRWRVLPSGDCLVLAVWKSALFGKPERKEWILVRYTGHGTLGDETDPMTLHEALCRVAALTADDKKRRIRPASRSRG
jgi:hypothetical protein